MFGNPLGRFLLHLCVSVFVSVAPQLVYAQAGGPQRVPVPPPLAKPNASKPKTDRSVLAPIPAFKDVAKQLGVTVPHIAAPEAHYVIDSTSGGTGLFDCDDDGRLDIVLVNGSTVERLQQGGDPMVTLYHQEPDGSFKDITAAAGLTRKGWGMGVAVADFDNDGKLDLFVTGYTGSVLYHSTISRSSAATNSAASKASSSNAVPGASKAKATSSITIAATAPSKKSPSKPASTTISAITASV